MDFTNFAVFVINSNNLNYKGENIMAQAFDISKLSEERRKGPATWDQCEALGYKFAAKPHGKMDFAFARQIRGCLYARAKTKKFTFEQAHGMFSKKALPKVYANMIKDYIAQGDK